MRILLVEKPAFTYPCEQSYIDIIRGIAGKWVEVETEHLFDDQYNVAEARVFEKHVVKIEDDARIGRMKCQNCGTHSPISHVCPKCFGEWGRDKQWLLKPFPQNRPYTWFVIESEADKGFWNNSLGWVCEARIASRFKVDDLLRLCLPLSNGKKYAEGIQVIPLRGNYNRRYDD